MTTPPRHTITPAELEAAARASYEHDAERHRVLTGRWPDWNALGFEVQASNVAAFRAGLSTIGIEVQS
ncbi:hypothetical protein [Nesterenkonia suensis]